MYLPVARLLSGASAGADENEEDGLVAGLVIEPTGDYADEYRRLGFISGGSQCGDCLVWTRPGTATVRCHPGVIRRETRAGGFGEEVDRGPCRMRKE